MSSNLSIENLEVENVLKTLVNDQISIWKLLKHD